MVGSGAWKFGEWRPGESITLTRNDDYYDKVPYLDSYVIRIWPDQTAVINALLNGELDSAGLEPGDVETVEATEGLVACHLSDPRLLLLLARTGSGEDKTLP